MLSVAPGKKEPLAMRQVEHWQPGEQLCGNDLGILMESKLCISWHCALAAKNANNTLSIMNRSMTYKQQYLRENFVP